MKLKALTWSVAAAAIVSMSGTVHAATADPAEFDSVFDEGAGDFGTVDLNSSGNNLIIGAITDGDTDIFNADDVSGTATITVLSFAEAMSTGSSVFSASYEFFVDGVPFGGGSIAAGDVNIGDIQSFTFANNDLSVSVTGTGGSADFEIGVSVTAVPVPAAGLLMFGALGGLAAMRRRKKA